MTKSFGDPAPASGRSKQSSLVRTKRCIKNASKGRALRQRVRSWDLFAPFFHLHDRQERPTLPLDHAELCAQTICENAGGNGAYQVLPGMIWDSAYPPSCGARHEGGWAKNPSLSFAEVSFNFFRSGIQQACPEGPLIGCLPCGDSLNTTGRGI